MTTFILFAMAIAALAVYWSKLYYETRYPNSEQFLANTVHLSANPVLRLFMAVGYQAIGRNPVCTSDADLTGQLILLTGGNAGIGFETAKDLYRRGADIIIASRNKQRGMEAVGSIKEQASSEAGSIDYIQFDLSDLNSVVALTVQLEQQLGGRQIDLLIQNAALVPPQHISSSQGHELAFATNVLGPHLLMRRLVDRGILKENAKVVVVTGDIYITVKDMPDGGCAPDYPADAPSMMPWGMVAYSRSKLGLMWQFSAMHRRHPQLRMYLLHPGVIATELTGEKPPAFVSDYLMLDNTQGAQTTLIVATARDEQLENGAYYHNCVGKAILHPSNDPATDVQRADAFWTLLETLTADFQTVNE